MKLYSIYDTKAKEFGDPILCKNDEVAIRMFNQAISKAYAPEDFQLFELSNFDNENGILFDAVADCKIMPKEITFKE